MRALQCLAMPLAVVQGCQWLAGAHKRLEAGWESKGALAGWKAKAGLLWLGFPEFAFGRAILIDVSPKAIKAGLVIR